MNYEIRLISHSSTFTIALIKDGDPRAVTQELVEWAKGIEVGTVTPFGAMEEKYHTVVINEQAYELR